MKFEVIEEHKPSNANPIQVRKGEKVKLGRKSDEEDGWSNWIYCYSSKCNSEGWIPVQIIQIENEYGIIIDDYSAIELEVSKGDMVDGELELNGWLWCSRLNDFESGWLPKEKLITVL
jgi:hypothetical protein